MCEKGSGQTERSGQHHAKQSPGQAIREIGATNCRLHSLKAETSVGFWTMSNAWHLALCWTYSNPNKQLCKRHSTSFYSKVWIFICITLRQGWGLVEDVCGFEVSYHPPDKCMLNLRGGVRLHVCTRCLADIVSAAVPTRLPVFVAFFLSTTPAVSFCA